MFWKWDGRHVSIEVISPLFEGQSAVKRQRMVYKVRWSCCCSGRAGFYRELAGLEGWDAKRLFWLPSSCLRTDCVHCAMTQQSALDPTNKWFEKSILTRTENAWGLRNIPLPCRQVKNIPSTSEETAGAVHDEEVAIILHLCLQAIWLELQEAVHAVDSMTTKTPAEAGMQ
eukprot:1159382-Pelagomonas_calceolata.AAC.5